MSYVLKNWTLKLRLNVFSIVSLPVLWVLFYVKYPHLPGSPAITLSCFVIYFLYIFWLFRDIFFSITISVKDFLAFLCIAFVQFFTHWFNLGQSLGGDELYHAEQSSFILKRIGEFVESLPEISQSDHLRTMWSLFDIRFFSVIDIWRVVSFLVLLLLTVFFTILFSIKNKRQKAILLCFFFGFIIIVGIGLSYAEELPHPPLRLFPLFVGHFIFGLNDFAFRVPSIVTLIFLSFFCYKLLGFHMAAPRSSGNYTDVFRCIFSILISFIPVVFYVGDAVEPSIYGFAAWVIVLLLCYSALVFPEKGVQFILWSGIVTSLGSTCRQSTSLLWIIVCTTWLLLFAKKKLPFEWKSFLQTFSLGFILLPYGYTLSVVGHIVMTEKTPLLYRLWLSIQSGVGIMSILNTTTLPWVVIIFITLAFALFFDTWKTLWGIAFFIPAYILFHSIFPLICGVGRYQAEYVAPFICFILFVFFKNIERLKIRIAISFIAVILMIASFEVQKNLSLDTNYSFWGQMRITTTAYLPYTDALRFLKRVESDGYFVVIGGQPYDQDMVMWLSGYNFTETKRKRELQLAFDKRELLLGFDKFIPNAKSFDIVKTIDFLKGSGVQYILVQGGTKRELQCQTYKIKNLAKIIETDQNFYKKQNFIDVQGGTIDIFGIR